MYPHRIRLRGPWQCEPLTGRVRFTRRFGYPGRIDDFERVWLTVAGVNATAELKLNGIPIGRFTAADKSFEAEVTACLQLRNELIIETEVDTSGSLWGEVALEVRCLAFLRDICITPASDMLQISGKAVGTSDQPLELYAIVNRYTAAYAMVTPTLEGTPFCLSAELSTGSTDTSEPSVIRVDLVKGASVWYTFEQVRPFPFVKHSVS